MTELVGDVCIPSELIIPKREGSDKPTKAGALYLSSGKLYFYNGSAEEAITSA